ncbi:MAG: lipoyl(octanoyl) transferase LipB [Actinomycetota bacterium]|nr:lipoyl(octanoyl) transferase LipB [Actinomycetota bacterium]
MAGVRPLLLAVHAGTVRYEEAASWQRRLAAARNAGGIDDVVLTLEHDRVYTAGPRADVATHVLGTKAIRVVRTDRGGDVTYHGPGQLVAYPIVRLTHAKAVRAHVEALEETCVRTAASFGVAARADRRRPGVWVGRDKLAAVGIRVDGRVTTHGLAFNVSTDLDDFAGLIPCGLADTGVCSLASLGVQTTVAEVRRRLVGHLGATLGRRVRWVPAADLGPAALAS